jgi:glycosyltransferase involved in cell wall biosynthesis
MLERNSAFEVSVVVPVRNEEDSIRALLDGLLNQTLAPKEISLPVHEIIFPLPLRPARQ